MTRHSGLLLAAAALVAGCAPGSMAERPYPPTHPASAEAPPTPFVRPANLFTAAAMPAASGEAGPMAHAGMDDRGTMAHGGMDRMAGDHGAVAGSDRPRAANQTAQADSGAKPSGIGTVHSVDAERGGLLKSDDGGTTWQDAYWLRQPATMVHVTPASEVYAFVIGTGLIRTSEPNLGWQPVSDDFGEEYVLHFAVDPTDQQKLYAVMLHPQSHRQTILASRDGGTTWSAFGIGTN